MTPADVIRADRLADLVCHDEQMTIWTSEVLDELDGHVVLPTSYEDALAHVDKCRIHRRMDRMSMKPGKLSAVLSWRVAIRRAFFSLLKQLSMRFRRRYRG